jgi:hypothetical protein
MVGDDEDEEVSSNFSFVKSNMAKFLCSITWWRSFAAARAWRLRADRVTGPLAAQLTAK